MQPGTTRRIRRAAVAVVAVAGVVIGGWLAIGYWRAPPRTTFTTAPATMGEVVRAVTASGTLTPVVEVEVGSQVSGRIAEVLVDYNDQVTEGQVLARIDRALLDSALGQARARLSRVRAELSRARAAAASARTEHARALGLWNSGTVARAEVDAAAAARKEADASVAAAAASVVEARGAVDQAQANLTYATILAPVDGVVISRNVDVGQTVAASLQAPTLFVLAGDLRDMEVHTSVAESDVGLLDAGMRVEFSVDAFPERTFRGTVRQVRFEPTTTSSVVTYDAVIAVRNDPVLLRPGMTANATFIVAERDGVLTVPSRALRYRPADAGAAPRAVYAQGGARSRPKTAAAPRRRDVVWVLRAGRPVGVAIETGLTDGSVTEVTAGDLAEGDLVITADSATRSTGAPARGTRRPPGPF
jgi:HlyD family secretion protein